MQVMYRFAKSKEFLSDLCVKTIFRRSVTIRGPRYNDRSSVDPTRTLNNLPVASRSLYTDTALGINKLDRLRDQKSQLFVGLSRERYIERITSYLSSADTDSIYRDDLVNLIGIAKDESDLDIIEQLVTKTKATNSSVHQGWGALLLRLYYKMNQIDRAYKNVKDESNFGDFFNLRSCYKVLMTMLYDAGRYDDVIEIYKLAQERLRSNDDHVLSNVEDGGAERDLITVAFAALARVNNQDALVQAQELYNKLKAQNPRSVGLRPSSLFAYIACSNDQPRLALNLISNTPNRNYISLRELKIVSLIKLERFEDILLQLREYVAGIKRESNLLLKTTYDVILENQDKIGDETVLKELNALLKEIKDNGHVADTTLEELIFKPIDSERPPSRINMNQGYKFDRFDRRFRDNNNYNDYIQGNNMQAGESQYQSRPPRDQYNNQYNNQRRQQRRYDDDGDQYNERSDNQGYRTRNNDRNSQRRFTYQNMHLD